MIKGVFDYFRLVYHQKHYSVKRIKKYQLKEIKKIFNYAIKHSEFYRKLYQGYKLETWDDFYRLPLINKQIMMDNLTTLNTINAKKEDLVEFALNQENSKDYLGYFNDQYVVGLSSGTSGNKGIFITDKELTERLPFVFLARSGIPLSLLPFNILFFLRVYSQGFDDINSKFIKLKYMSTMNDVQDAIKTINDLQINILMAPPSFVRVLLPYIQDIKSKIRLIMTYAEVLSKEEKAIFIKKFNAEVIEIYQASEGQIASSCKKGHLHLNEDLVFVELYDEEGNQLSTKDKVASKMIVTNLVNYAQPLIRYEMNDLLVLDDKCECGSNFRLIDKIMGRSDDVLYFYNEKKAIQRVFPDLFVRWIITFSDEIKEFQVVSNTINEVIIYLELLHTLDLDMLRNKILNELKTYNIVTPKIEILEAKLLLPKEKNKFKRFIRKYDL